METTGDAAAQLGLSQRQVQRLARSGRLMSREVAGRTVVAARSILAMSRMSGRGRTWNDVTVAAACELLESGATDLLAASSRSRLRARVRTISIPQLAYQVLSGRVTQWRSIREDADSRERIADGLSATGRGLDVMVTSDAGAFARRARLLGDPEGEVIVVESTATASAVIGDLALYAYGDERTSSAARRRLEARRDALS